MTSFHRTVLSATALAAVLALGACKKESVVAKDESAESVAKKVAASDIKPQPGRWEASAKMESMDMEGMPPQVKDAMTKQMATARTYSMCLTPEQVNRPDGGFFGGGGGEGCVYKTFAMVGGKIDAEMVCNKAMSGQMSMKIAGTYSETAYDVSVSTKTEAPGGKPMSMAMKVASHRTGDCDGKEDITAEDVKKMQDYAKAQEGKAK